MAVMDRLLGAFVALARGAQPTIDYQALYRAKVLKQHDNLRRVDLAPSDPRLPPMSNIPLRVGVPGLDVTISPGHLLLIGWENGQPDHPFACLWEAGTEGDGTLPLKLTLNATVIELGGAGLKAALDGVVRAETTCMFTGAPHFAAGKTSLAVMAKVGP
jgi:hypothetical protein